MLSRYSIISLEPFENVDEAIESEENSKPHVPLVRNATNVTHHAMQKHGELENKGKMKVYIEYVLSG